MYCDDYANAYYGGSMQAGAPKMPMMPGMPTTPSMPWMPTMPTTPSMPNIPMGPGMPTTPYMPSMPGMPTTPMMPSMPGMPTTPMMPGMPTTPMMPVPPETPLQDTSPSITMPMGPDFIIQPGPPVQEDINYTQGFLKTLIGRFVNVDFLIGTNMFVDRQGTLVAVGISYIVLREPQTNRLVLCDIYSLKFVNILN